MGRLLLLWLLAGETAVGPSGEPAGNRYQFAQTEMAVPIQDRIVCPQSATASRAAEAAFSRFHTLNSICSDYDPESELRRLCRTSSAGHAVRVSEDLWRVLVCRQELSQRSEGAFDVTIGPVVRLWRSGRHTKELPSRELLDEARSRVGYRLMRLDSRTHSVELLKANMRLDLGGIAKGYAVDEAMAALRKHGIARMMVEAGGNIGLGDAPPGKAGWRIGIAPPDAHSPPREYLELARVAISTSGDMWQYAIIGGKRYSHLIDPHSGMALTDHSNVTVVGPDGLSTDGLSSAVAILGPEKGLKLVEATPHSAAFIVRLVNGKEQTFQSKRWRRPAERRQVRLAPQRQYFAHAVVEDSFGVVAPWYRGQNGQCDWRLRITAETLKRYPWADKDLAVMAAPHFVFNGHWSIRSRWHDPRRPPFIRLGQRRRGTAVIQSVDRNDELLPLHE